MSYGGVSQFGIVTMQAQLFQNAQVGEQLGAAQGKAQEGAGVEQVDVHGLPHTRLTTNQANSARMRAMRMYQKRVIYIS